MEDDSRKCHRLPICFLTSDFTNSESESETRTKELWLWDELACLGLAGSSDVSLTLFTRRRLNDPVYTQCSASRRHKRHRAFNQTLKETDWHSTSNCFEDGWGWKCIRWRSKGLFQTRFKRVPTANKYTLFWWQRSQFLKKLCST